MRFLLDTNVLIDLTTRFDEPGGFSEPDLFEQAVGKNPFLVSVVSIWEIAIKTRLNKLHLNVRPEHLLGMVEAAGGIKLHMTEDHVLAPLSVEPATRDPFDRLLLTTAAAENALLVTRDGALQAHPLVWRAITG